MAFEEKNYAIKERLPEWWKNDALIRPVNEYTQELIVEILGSLLSNLGVVQPVQVWKELPEEYNWLHKYYSSDEYLDSKTNVFQKNITSYAYLPNTKRNCHAIISLSLQGDNNGKNKLIDLSIKNAHQEIVLTQISNMSNIVIDTRTHDVLINGIHNSDAVQGFFDTIKPSAKNEQYDEVDIRDENKKTQIEFTATENTVFNLEVELIKPVFTTEQHIRISTVSAFPLEWIKMYGFYCHQFNNKEGYELVWEKNYPESSRIVYDKIATQFDFERFYIQVKFKGIGSALFFGFPQEVLPSNGAFMLNENLDKWGNIYGMPRRIYRTDISESEEPFTFPKYYNYPVEQDYWYEQRMVNEYRYNENAINNTFIKDSDMNNVAILESISPFIDDVWVYTETVVPKSDLDRETANLLPCSVNEISTEGVHWEYPQAIMQENIISKEILLEPLDGDVINHDNNAYKTRVLDLKFKVNGLPNNIDITGIELKLNAETNIHSDALKIDDRSKMILPFVYTKNNGDEFTVTEEIPINTEDKPWRKGQKTYTIGGKDYLFGLETVKKEQVDDYLHFKLGFTNESDFLQARLLIHTVTAKLYYRIIKDEFTISTQYDTKEIILSKQQNQVQLKINVENTGKTIIEDKNITIMTPPELTLTDNRPSTKFNLNIGESFTMGDENDTIFITTKNTTPTGKYDILIFCDDKVIQDEILVRRGFE